VAWVAVAGIILLAYQLVISVSEPCAEGTQYNPVCLDDTHVSQPSCSSGYVSYTSSACASGQTCAYGVCLDTSCTSGSKNTCASSYSRVQQVCQGGKFTNILDLCPSGEACVDGSCKSSSAVAGVLSSWDTLYAAVAASSQLQEYTKCVDAFDCANPKVIALADKIATEYKVTTPRQYVDAVSEYVHGYVTYEFYGGKQQCGESASSMIATKESDGFYKGNCVDYSVLAASLMRVKRIPVQQAAGCLNSFDLKCTPLSIVPQELHYGGLNGEQALAHSYLLVYDPKGGWLIVDPTVGAGISKCAGYMTLQSSGTQTVCYLPSGSYSQCKAVF
jgi:hypothetical protein